jgi:hypothetical protein
MCASGEEAVVGDVVQGSVGRGQVLIVTQSSLDGQETATVQWTTPLEKVLGISERPARVTVSMRSLTLVSRNRPPQN